MDVGAGPYMYDVVVEKFTFAISSPDKFLLKWTTVRRKQNTKPAIHGPTLSTDNVDRHFF